MSYEKYQDMIAQIDGIHIDKKARYKAREEAGITTIDFKFNDEANENAWNGTLYLLKGEPVHINFYIWKVEGPTIERLVSERVGFPVQFEDFSGGNGHYSARVVRRSGDVDTS